MSISPNSKPSYVGPLSPEFALLGLLHQEPAHGYELHQRIEDDLGQVWHVSLSQTYNILNRLEAQGYINGVLQEQDKLPARRTFYLTEAGRQRFESWLHTPSGCSVRAIRVEFITRLYFVRAVNTDLSARIINDQEAELRAGLIRLEKKLTDTPPEGLYNRLGLELRIRQIESIIAWLDRCRDILDQTSSEPRSGGLTRGQRNHVGGDL